MLIDFFKEWTDFIAPLLGALLGFIFSFLMIPLTMFFNQIKDEKEKKIKCIEENITFINSSFLTLLLYYKKYIELKGEKLSDLDNSNLNLLQQDLGVYLHKIYFCINSNKPQELEYYKILTVYTLDMYNSIIINLASGNLDYLEALSSASMWGHYTYLLSRAIIKVIKKPFWRNGNKVFIKYNKKTNLTELRNILKIDELLNKYPLLESF